MRKSLTHRGEVVEVLVRKSGIKIITLAKKIGKNPGTIYNWFSYPNLGWDKIEKIGKVIGHDFRIEFPEMPMYMDKSQSLSPNILSEPEEKYGTANQLKRCLQELELIKSKYISLLEVHNKLLRELKK